MEDGRWKWYGGLEEGGREGREVLGGKEGKEWKGRAEGLIMKAK